jgi:protein SCO1/2
MKRLNFYYAVIFLMTIGDSVFAAPDDADTQNAKTYPARGIIQHIAPDRSHVTIKHEKIPGYMMAMTMDFPVRDTNALAGFAPNDEITFQLVVRTNDDWIENVKLVSHHAGAVTNNVFIFHAENSELGPGDVLPDGELTAEDGRTIHFSDFRGRALAFTFFFTRCPLPDFCPRMNRNFAEARELLATNSVAPTNWEFLSVSFDPAFDTPQMLSGFSNLYRGDDTNKWLFAAASTNVLANLAPRLDLMVVHEGESISHNLRTVVLDTNGRIFRQFDGNTWTPQELADAIAKAAGK